MRIFILIKFYLRFDKLNFISYIWMLFVNLISKFFIFLFKLLGNLLNWV